MEFSSEGSELAANAFAIVGHHKSNIYLRVAHNYVGMNTL